MKRSIFFGVVLCLMAMNAASQDCVLSRDLYNIKSLEYTNRKLDYGERYAIDFPGESPVVRGIAFSSDGGKMFVMTDASTDDDDLVYEYDLLTPWDFLSWKYNSQKAILDSELGIASVDARGIAFSSDGTKFYVIDVGGGDRVYQYSLSTEFDISTASFAPDNKSFDYTGQISNPLGLVFNNDGTKMYISSSHSTAIQQYSLSTEWDVSTATPETSFSVTDGTGIIIVKFNNVGSRMYIFATTENKIFEYSLSTEFDISTATFTGKSVPINDQDSDPVSIEIRSGGLALFVSGNDTDHILQYQIAGWVLTGGCQLGGGAPEVQPPKMDVDPTPPGVLPYPWPKIRPFDPDLEKHLQPWSDWQFPPHPSI